MPVNLKLSNESLQKIIDIEGTPLQIYDSELIIENLREFLNKMSSNFTGFRQYFAVKALPNPHILKLLINNGCYLDCSSLTELKIAEDLGLSGEKIMFTSNYTSKEDLELAAKTLDLDINNFYYDENSFINFIYWDGPLFAEIPLFTTEFFQSMKGK
jgi:diaminopimelate decarboxylase